MVFIRTSASIMTLFLCTMMEARFSSDVEYIVCISGQANVTPGYNSQLGV